MAELIKHDFSLFPELSIFYKDQEQDLLAMKTFIVRYCRVKDATGVFIQSLIGPYHEARGVAETAFDNAAQLCSNLADDMITYAAEKQAEEEQYASDLKDLEDRILALEKALAEAEAAGTPAGTTPTGGGTGGSTGGSGGGTNTNTNANDNSADIDNENIVTIEPVDPPVEPPVEPPLNNPAGPNFSGGYDETNTWVGIGGYGEDATWYGPEYTDDKGVVHGPGPVDDDGDWRMPVVTPDPTTTPVTALPGNATVPGTETPIADDAATDDAATDDAATDDAGDMTPLVPGDEVPSAEDQARTSALYDRVWEEQAANDPLGRTAEELRTAWEEREPISFEMSDSTSVGYGEPTIVEGPYATLDRSFAV